MKEKSILQNSVDEGSPRVRERLSWRARFTGFVKRQEANRFLWMIVSLIAQSCVVTPGVLGLIFYSGASLLLLLFSVAAVMIVFVTNLAATPVRIILPAFALSLAIDAAIVLLCLGKIVF